MVIIRLSGGLGNQMFQYAFGRKLRTLGREVFFDDVSGYERQEETGVCRPVQLGLFGIDYPRARKEDITRLRDASLRLPARIRRKIFGRRSRERSDRDFIFAPELLSLDEVYFSGCFQSPRYFEDIEQEIRECFAFPEGMPGLDEALRRRGEQLRAENSVAVHLRFGDYLDKAETYGGITTRAYYEAALRIAAAEPSSGGAVHFYIFTNEAPLAEREFSQMELPENAGFTVLSGSDEEHGYLDLYLMSCCRRHIIANSSFSWWGAFLASSEQVIAPSLWIHMPDGSDAARTDIFTEDMLRINRDGQRAAGPGAAEPLVSVIVAAYNIERYLPRALDSLLWQTWRRLDILVVDDGSTDGTPGIADAYAARDPRIRVIHKANGGLSDARNAALPEARGDYIGYLDGDDWCEPEMYEAMVRACLLTGAEISAVQYRQVQETQAESILRSPARPRDIDHILSGSVLLNRCGALENYLGPGEPILFNSVWSKLFRRDIADGILFQTGKNSEDIVYTGRTFCRITVCAVLREPLYDYLSDRQGSIMNRKLGERRLRDEIPNWCGQIACFRENGLPDIADRALYMLCRRLLAYDLEFRRTPGMKAYARELEALAESNRDEIRRIYGADYVRRGDRFRMALFLRSPGCYARAAALYERLAVPLKSGARRLIRTIVSEDRGQSGK
ncbi:glycosyltransferase [Lachnoclostridium sp. Marseille-P6806]|uniref:glycosyltransferase n=1 Tax=Lachnoclostridium sp. Marseille-P6806 TaxID=2364793 RepID=UPI001F5E3878|nr:glycosyltransferase [Lachnoclostridium sp. Marseille-P6806]